MNKNIVSLFLVFTIFMSACQPTTPGTAPADLTPSGASYKDPSLPPEQRAADLLSRMTLDEKIGQMTQVEKNSINPADVTRFFIGSILSGGGGSPASNNTPEGWIEMVGGFQQAALQTRLAIPMLYGVDAVHGHNNLRDATIFPHNIGLGATRNAALVEKIGRATAEEMLATDVPWNFAPVVAVPQDIRWGRTYEGYGENTELVTELGVSFLRGLQSLPESVPGQSLYALGTPKHFVGDGATTWDTSNTAGYSLDQGDMRVDEATLRARFLPPYKAVVDAGAQSIMASFSSWNGTKMHAQKYLLTDVLKGELGFTGFIVSDWQAIDQISLDYYKAVVTALNAGVDMNMVPSDYKKFIETTRQAVERGDIPQARIDDAVLRILTVKFKLGLFERPTRSNADLLATIHSDAHRQLARQAVAESLVLLKNDNAALPLAKDTPVILVAGRSADSIGMQSGGWTMTWQGTPGNITDGTTILKAIQAVATGQVVYNSDGNFKEDGSTQADIGVVVLAESPYAEGVGDSATLSIGGMTLLEKMRTLSKKLVVIILSGRPIIITDQLPLADAWVAAWLPGSEGQGVADVLFGDLPFTGVLSYTWPRSVDQLPFKVTGCRNEEALFPYGYGLDAKTNQVLAQSPACP